MPLNTIKICYGAEAFTMYEYLFTFFRQLHFRVTPLVGESIFGTVIEGSFYGKSKDGAGIYPIVLCGISLCRIVDLFCTHNFNLSVFRRVQLFGDSEQVFSTYSSVSSSTS